MGSVNATVQIDVEGHASARWRGAKSAAEAASRNEALSFTRAHAVGTFVESVLKTQMPGVTFVLTGNGFPHAKIPVSGRMTGFGARKPIIREGKNSDHPFNRSVFVSIRLVTSRRSQAVKHRTVPLQAFSQYWGLEVIEFDAAAVVVGSGYIKFRLTNGATNRSRRYESRLKGVGLDNPLSEFKDATKNPVKEKAPRPKPENPDPDQVWFSTAKPIGFAHFDTAPGKNITVKKAKAGFGLPRIKVGIASSVTLLGFDGLGGQSDSVMIDWDVEISGLTFSGYRLTGQITPMDPHPGDYLDIGIESYEVDLPLANREVSEAMAVFFETGKADLPDAYKRLLLEWASRWAASLRALADNKVL